MEMLEEGEEEGGGGGGKDTVAHKENEMWERGGEMWAHAQGRTDRQETGEKKCCFSSSLFSIKCNLRQLVIYLF